jgi:hypothetical protein
MNKSLRIDFWVISGIIIFSIPIILKFEVRPLTSVLFFFVIPTLYLFIRKKKPIKRVLVGSLLIGVLISFVFNIILSANNAWNELSSQLVIKYRIFGFWPADEPIWFFFWILFIIVFYGHFYDREKRGNISKRFKYLAIPSVLVLSFILWAYATQITSFTLPYAYFILASPSIVPIGYVLKKYPRLIPKFI